MNKLEIAKSLIRESIREEIEKGIALDAGRTVGGIQDKINNATNGGVKRHYDNSGLKRNVTNVTNKIKEKVGNVKREYNHGKVMGNLESQTKGIQKKINKMSPKSFDLAKKTIAQRYKGNADETTQNNNKLSRITQTK